MKGLLILFLIALGLNATAQSSSDIALKNKTTKISWKDLKIDSMSDAWSDEFNAYYAVVHFSSEVEKMNGKVVEIIGFYYPIDIVDGYYLLTEDKDIGFGCVLGGNTIRPDNAMEIKLSECHAKYGDRIKVMGTLVLNKDDLYQLSYIIKDAKYELVDK